MQLKTKNESLPSDSQRPGVAAAARPGLFDKLFQPVDASFLAFFRIAFGLTMLAQMWYYIKPSMTGDWFDVADSQFVRPDILFSYFGFEWVRPLPAVWLHLHFVLLAFLSVAVALGLFYRTARVLLCVGYVYVFILDKTNYNNHYYLLCLVSFLMCFLPAQRMFSLDARLKPSIQSQTVPAWTLWLLRVQIGIPYFYCGLAKLYPDWLQGEPIGKWVREGLLEVGHLGLPGERLKFVVYLICYGGLAFDLLVVPLLLWRRTRRIAFLTAIVFNVANSQLFHIGVFPWFMIAGSTIFFSPDWPRRAIAWLTRVDVRFGGRRAAWEARQAHSRTNDVAPAEFESETSTARRRWTLALLAAYLAFQLLWPLRHHVYEGDPGWNGKGDLFAWRMMLYDKVITEMKFFAADPGDNQTSDGRRKKRIELPAALVNEAASQYQIFRLPRDPNSILQLSDYIAERSRRSDGRKPEIYALIKVSYNTRKPQLLVDPEVNLAAVEQTLWGPTPWIMPFENTPLPSLDQTLHGLPPLPFIPLTPKEIQESDLTRHSTPEWE